MVGPLLRSFGSRSAGDDRRNSSTALRGCLDYIGPCLITGWVQHPRQPIREVVLQGGAHQLSLAQPTLRRPDVASLQGGDGQVGFSLAIDEQLPLVVFTGRPAVVALDEQGGAVGELLMNGESSQTVRRLRAALDPRHRGLRGHWDGFDPQTGDLVGWAHHGRRGEAVVWLQQGGEPPRPVPCNLPRHDILENGLPRACGFQIPWPLPADPDSGRARPLLSLDREGLLPLAAAG